MEVLQPTWRGRAITSRKDSGGRKYTAMVGPKSLLYIPVNILPNAVYKVTLELCRESGNGILYCNLYGNRNFDFHHSRIICESGNWTTFDVDVITKDFPNTVPMVFRMWRGNGGTGTILVRKIVVQLENGFVEKPQTVGQIVLVKESGPTPPNPATVEAPQIVLVKESGPTPPNPATVEAPQIVLVKESGPTPPNPAKTEKSVVQPEKKSTEKKRIKRTVKEPPPNPPPKPLPAIIGEDGIKVSVVISLYNRLEFFNRTLMTYVKQTLPKEEFELVVVDDGSTENILGLCEEYAQNYGLKFQYVLIDSSKGDVTQRGFTPALSNNIGFKLARGSVIVITGPESLQGDKNLELSYEAANDGYCVYGTVGRSSKGFVDELKRQDWENMSFEQMYAIPGAKYNMSVLDGWWWYYVAVRKEHIMAINGVDERFMLGIAGEDDNFAIRMLHYGVPLVRNANIVGIHQDHSREDKIDSKHSFRFSKKKWEKLRKINCGFLNEWKNHKDPVANKNIDWGSEKAIVLKKLL